LARAAAASAAGAIVDDDGTAEDFLEGGRDRARGQVGLPAGRERYDHRDGAIGPILLRPDGRDPTKRRGGQKRQGYRAF
jgi:hypothetical protein